MEEMFDFHEIKFESFSSKSLVLYKNPALPMD